jgi:hypothetical protein
LVYYILLNANTWNLFWSRTWFTHLSIVGCYMLSRNCLPFRNTRVHHVFLPVLVVHVVKLHVFTLLDPCCYVRHDFRAKTMFDSSWLLLFVFIYVWCCPTRYPYQIMFVSFNSNMTGVTCGAGTANFSGAPGITPVFSRVRVALCNVL